MDILIKLYYISWQQHALKRTKCKWCARIFLFGAQWNWNYRAFTCRVVFAHIANKKKLPSKLRKTNRRAKQSNQKYLVKTHVAKMKRKNDSTRVSIYYLIRERMKAHREMGESIMHSIIAKVYEQCIKTFEFLLWYTLRGIGSVACCSGWSISQEKAKQDPLLPFPFLSPYFY